MTTTAETFQERVDRERRERTEVSKTAAAEVAAALTAETSERWTGSHDPENYTPHFKLARCKDGLTVSAGLSTHRRPPTWHVYPASVTAPDASRLWLNDHRKSGEDTSANIGQGKTPVQIARDIVRRILPIAEDLAHRAIEARQVDLERKAWLDKTTAELCAKSHVPLRLSHHDEMSTRRELRHWGKPYVTLTLDACDQLINVAVEDIASEVALRLLGELPQAITEE